jgi:pteridine reductase
MSEHRAALVTGGAKRVGRQIALSLAAAGFDVAIVYQNSKNEADEVIGQIRTAGQVGLAIRADLTDPAAPEKIAGQVRPAFGRLDALVNNASIYEPGETPEMMKKMWAVHVTAPLLLCRAFEADLRASGGHVVNMLDVMVERPWPKFTAYCASKAALWNLTLSLARDLAPDVTVNGIAPGVVEWPADYPEEERKKYLNRVPLARAGTPQDVAAAVLFYCGGGSYVTGQVLRLDGGRSLT